MTLKERIVVEVYTGVCMTSAEERDEVYKYMALIMGRQVFTHELASKEIQEELKEKSKDDFIELCSSDGGAKRPVEKIIAYCPVCENELYHGQTYCDNCGQKVDWQPFRA